MLSSYKLYQRNLSPLLGSRSIVGRKRRFPRMNTLMETDGSNNTEEVNVS